MQFFNGCVKGTWVFLNNIPEWIVNRASRLDVSRLLKGASVETPSFQWKNQLLLGNFKSKLLLSPIFKQIETTTISWPNILFIFWIDIININREIHKDNYRDPIVIILVDCAGLTWRPVFGGRDDTGKC